MPRNVQPVWRSIVKRNEVVPGGDGKPYDVLICKHAVSVPASTKANTYRRFRKCPLCRVAVQKHADEHHKKLALVG